MRQTPDSRRTQTSKQVPYCPPRTGLPSHFTQSLLAARPNACDAPRRTGAAAPAVIAFTISLLVIRLAALISFSENVLYSRQSTNPLPLRISVIALAHLSPRVIAPSALGCR